MNIEKYIVKLNTKKEDQLIESPHEMKIMIKYFQVNQCHMRNNRSLLQLMEKQLHSLRISPFSHERKNIKLLLQGEVKL